jgi:hypothetical protein
MIAATTEEQVDGKQRFAPVNLGDRYALHCPRSRTFAN